MSDDDEDFEDGQPERPAHSSTHRWLFVAAFLEVFVDITMAFHKLFSVFRDATLQKYRFDNERQRFMIDAALEIERLVSGDYDAPAKQARTGLGSGADESKD